MDVFLGRFKFTLAYRSGSWNVKPDALSHQFSPNEQPEEPETILPQNCVVASLTWEIKSLVCRAHAQQPDPGNGPADSLFVPTSIPFPSTPVGPVLMSLLPSWYGPHAVEPEKKVLVAHHEL